MKGIKTKFTALSLTLCLAACIFGGCGTREADKDTVRIGSLKGPTSMGLLFLMEKAEAQETESNYEFQMASSADELLPLLVKGELDIALIPANAAAILYGKTGAGISVIDVNTLGVLYMVSGESTAAQVKEPGDLKGRTVYLTGKGTTPDFVLRYLLQENGIREGDCSLEYKSQAAEVAAFLAENPDALGLLPQPFASAACAENPSLSVVFDCNEEWERLQGESGGRLVTGVTVVRDEFLEEHEEAVRIFLKEHEESALSINENTDKGAALAVKKGIVTEEAVAKEAIPKCGITCLTGEEMKMALWGYLEVLYGQSPEAVGGTLPGDDFYYAETP